MLATHPRGEERRLLLHELAQRQMCDSAFVRDAAVGARRGRRKRRVRRPGTSIWSARGRAIPDLLTVKALRLIESADVILHDDLVPQAILDLAAPQAEIVNVGKRCGDEDHHAGRDQRADGRACARRPQRGAAQERRSAAVWPRGRRDGGARLKPEVPFEIVPGVSAAFAAAAAIGCSLTDREWASNVIFSTGHHAQSHNRAALPALEDATRVVYMPGRDLTLLAAEWMAEGLPAELPCAVVSHAAQPDQQVVHTTLGELGELAPAAAPSLLMAGWAVRDRTKAERAVETPETQFDVQSS